MATVPASEKIRIRSALRLFLSLDVVGSTEFKQPRTDKESANDDSWVRPFLTFYRMSVDQMAAQWQRVTTEMKAVERGDTGRFVFGECPEFWKGAGDEVLFSKRVVSPLDAIAALHSLVGVMQAHRTQFATKPQTKNLNVKGSAWLAGFPLNNAEIVIATDSASAREGHADELTHNYRLLSLLDADPSRRAAYKADYIGPCHRPGLQVARPFDGSSLGRICRSRLVVVPRAQPLLASGTDGVPDVGSAQDRLHGPLPVEGHPWRRPLPHLLDRSRSRHGAGRC